MRFSERRKPGERRSFQDTDNAYRIGVGSLKYLSLHEIEVRGRRNIPDEAIFAATHRSYADPGALIFGLRKNLVFLSFPRALHFTRIGRVMIGNGPAEMRESCREMERRLDRGYSLVIFPEGKRNGGSIGDIKKGVFQFSRRLNVPIVPVAIKGAEKVWPNGQLIPSPFGKIKLNVGEAIKVPRDWRENDYQGILREELQSLYDSS